MPETAREGRLAAAFVQLVDTSDDDYDVSHHLHSFVRHCVELLDVTAATVVLITAKGATRLEVATSDPHTHDLEFAGLAWDEGPGRDCLCHGGPVREISLSEPSSCTAWPRFVPEAESLGVTSVVTAPLSLRDQVIGVLTLCRDRRQPLAADQLRLIEGLARAAAIGVLQRRAAEERDTEAARIRAALRSRVVVEQACGALAQRRRITVDQALRVLQVYARNQRRRLTDIAREVVESTTDLAVSGSGA
ncbi:ANTAR domain-containing protein [Streptomyces sp. NPDC054796]